MVDCACSGGWPNTHVHRTALTGLGGLWKENMKLGADVMGISLGSWSNHNILYACLKLSENE